MGGLIGGTPKADTSAMRQQIELQKQETERMRKQAEQERKDLAEQMASKRMARTRGGSRALLSEARLNPEAGMDEETLGA